MIILDLDGTVNDSSPGVKHCFLKTAQLYGKDLSEEVLNTGLSGQFVENLTRLLGLQPDQISEATDRYVELYLNEGQSMAEIFPGIPETIQYLKEKGYLIGMATLMGDEYAKNTLKMKGISHLFDSVHGASLTEFISKEQLIGFCLDDFDLDPSEAVMVGDGQDDHRASQVAGVDFIGVTYGYDIDEDYCKKHSLEFIGSPEDLRRLF